mmetsp:Transcript_10207/g.12455  ORF Transcript_10207/g.12455 Transcript_10207/m.12455 type:complete len:250 (-) Transcript_10207:410-1159(-)|eukprot:Skav209102  [mRNA]  locus=scaffold179:94298:95743:+ [translate_table: standard]
MSMALKFLVVLAGQSLVASFSPGDCGFVGIYGEEDDFAVVLLEDVGGEQLFVTEELPDETGLSVKKSFAAKTSVEDAERGSVLRRADFEVDASSLVAPTALTVFKGSASDPIPLCSLGLGRPAVARKLKEANLISLPLIETAEYSGSKSGSKDELLAEIVDPLNWHSLPGHGRRLNALNWHVNGLGRQLFTIARGSNSTTLTMTTTMTTEITATQTMTNMDIRDMGESDGAVGTSLACLLLVVGHLLSG